MQNACRVRGIAVNPMYLSMKRADSAYYWNSIPQFASTLVWTSLHFRSNHHLANVLLIDSTPPKYHKIVPESSSYSLTLTFFAGWSLHMSTPFTAADWVKPTRQSASEARRRHRTALTNGCIWKKCEKKKFKKSTQFVFFQQRTEEIATTNLVWKWDGNDPSHLNNTNLRVVFRYRNLFFHLVHPYSQ